jgi:lipoprotein signal peptidase
MSTKSRRSYRWLLWTIALIGFTVDQAGKYGVFQELHDEAVESPNRRTTEVLIPHALEFYVEYTDLRWEESAGVLQTWSGPYIPHVNRGAFLGLGNGDDGSPDFNVIFAVVSVVAAVVIIWYSKRRSIAGDGFLCVALGLIMAGDIGNLYDRIVFDGVRDYLYAYLPMNKDLHTAIFNLADFFLICGAVLLLIQAFFGKPVKEERPARSAAASRELHEMAQVK